MPVLGACFRGDERTSGRVTPERPLFMIVGVMVVMTVIMPMGVVITVAVMMVLVGAVLRIERRLDWQEPRAEPAQHVLDHMISRRIRSRSPTICRSTWRLPMCQELSRASS